MPTQFGLDLRLARRRAGLTQSDCAILIASHTSRISALEAGQYPPTVRELMSLSLVLSRSFEPYFQQEVDIAKRLIARNLDRLGKVAKTLQTENRDRTINSLRAKLSDLIDDDHAGA